MLAAMGERSFVVTIAYIKTEPVQVALFGLIFLGDPLNAGMVAAILIATAGVLVMSLKPGDAAATARRARHCWALRAGAMFALSAIGYRGAILSLDRPDFVMAATFTLVVGLLLQAVMLSLWLLLREPKVMRESWRPGGRRCSPGFSARSPRNSGFWLLRIATAASVRTLALVEVLFAQAISASCSGKDHGARGLGSC